MGVLKSHIDTKSEEFQANAEHNRRLAAEFREK